MKDIMLKIVGNQLDISGERSGDYDAMEFITEGRFYQKGDSLYLLYDESEFSGMEGCTTSLKVRGSTLTMRRYSEDAGMETSIEFEKDKRFNGIYETPFGNIPMEVLTTNVTNELDSSGKGKVELDYSVALKGLSNSRSRLSVEIMESAVDES